MRHQIIPEQFSNNEPSTVIGFTTGGTPTLYPVSGFSGGGGSGTVTGATNGLRMSGNGRLTALGGTLTGNTTVNTNGFGISIGYGNVSTACNSFATGANNVASGYYSSALGSCNVASGYASHVEGQYNCAGGGYSHVEGTGNCAMGYFAHAEGADTCANGSSAHSEGQTTAALGCTSHAQGRNTVASGCSSHSGGQGVSTKEIFAFGIASFNHSENNSSQTIGHGALANNSAIVGGQNHNIATGNTRAAIIGGNAIKLTGSTYTDTTAVSKLAIISTPSAGVTGDSVLVRRGTTGIIHAVAQSSIGGSGGVSTVLFNSYTGTTAPATYANKTKFNSFTASTVYDTIQIVINGLGIVPSTGIAGDVQIPFDCEILSVTIVANASGSIVVDIWKDTYSNFPPVVGDSITASAKPTLSSAVKSTDSTLTSWTKTLTKGDWLRYNIDSVSTLTRAVVVLNVKRTV